MGRRQTQALGMAVSAIIVVVAVIWWLRPPRDPIAFHKSQMEQAHAAMFAEPDVYQDGLVGYSAGDEHAQYEFHRSKLVELGAVLELNYEFKYLLVPTNESSHFSRFIMSQDAPACIDFSSPYPRDPKPMQITVWCYPEHRSAWDKLIASRDVDNYQKVFME